MTQPRTPPGVPTGGQYGATVRDEADATLEAETSVMDRLDNTQAGCSTGFDTVYQYAAISVASAQEFGEDESEAAEAALDEIINAATAMKEELARSGTSATSATEALATKRAQLTALEAEFAGNGGRGVDIADKIDQLRADIEHERLAVWAAEGGADGHKQLRELLDEYDIGTFDSNMDAADMLTNFVHASRIADAQHRNATPTPIDRPYTRDELAARADRIGVITAYVAVDPSDLIGPHSASEFYTYGSAVTGVPGMEADDGRIVGVAASGDLIIKVEMDVSSIINDEPWSPMSSLSIRPAE